VPEFRVSFTKVTLQYFQVDVYIEGAGEIAAPAYAESKALRLIVSDPSRHVLPREDHSFMCTDVRQI